MISRIIPASFGAAALALFSLGCSATEERAGYQPVTATAADAARPLLMSRPRDREEPVRQAQYEEEWQAAPPLPGEEERPSSLRDSTPSSDPPLSNSDGFLMDEPLDLAIGSDGMTLEALQQLALNNNPAILQGSSAANKAAGIRTQVGLGPNPTIGYSGQEIGNDGAAGLHAAFVSQTFVRGGKLAANQDVVGHEQQAILWQVEALRHRVRTDIKTRFYEALAAQERIRLARQFLEVANEVLRLLRTGLKHRLEPGRIFCSPKYRSQKLNWRFAGRSLLLRPRGKSWLQLPGYRTCLRLNLWVR